MQQIINKGLHESIGVLQEKLSEYVENETQVSVHCHNHGMIIRFLLTPEEFEVTEEGLFLQGGWSEINTTEHESGKIVGIDIAEQLSSIGITFENGEELFLDT